MLERRDFYSKHIFLALGLVIYGNFYAWGNKPNLHILFGAPLQLKAIEATSSSVLIVLLLWWWTINHFLQNFDKIISFLDIGVREGTSNRSHSDSAGGHAWMKVICRLVRLSLIFLTKGILQYFNNYEIGFL